MFSFKRTKVRKEFYITISMKFKKRPDRGNQGPDHKN